MPDTNLSPMPLLSDVRLNHFGPATVTGLLGAEIEVEAAGRRCLARLAVACVYQPALGDVVLLAATEDAAYVIGVLAATGPLTLLAPQDLRLWAPHGRIELVAGELLASADAIDLQTDRLDITARRLRETFESVQRIVRGLLDLQAGEVRARVGEMFSLFSRRFRAAADEDVRIDGSSIDLG